MHYRRLGKTGIDVSALAFGAGPVSGLLTAAGDTELQFATIRRAIDLGINWFDTAATYASGESERALGAALARLGRPSGVHLATKVRLDNERMNDIAGQVRSSVKASLERLQASRVTLLQLHNAVTEVRNQEPTSITREDVLCRGGVLEAFEQLRDEGLALHLGLTGTGHPAAMKEVVSSGRFDVIQVPYHLLNPSAAESMPAGFAETNYGGIINDCAKQDMGVMVIRVYAGGSLLLAPPSAHTLTTKFFPLDLYGRDVERAKRLATLLPGGLTLQAAALRYVLANPTIAAAIIGFGSPEHVTEAAECLAAGPLGSDILALFQNIR